MNRATATFVAATLALGGAACDSTVRPIEPTAQVEDCSRCHGYPPPAFVAGGTTHTTSTECSACHPGTVAADNVTIIPGGLHMNGVVDVNGGVAHEMPYPASAHGPAALDNISSCTACHGADYGGGAGPSCNGCHGGIAASTPGWKTNCTFCHGTRTANVTTATAQAAPPQAVAGATATTDPKVGAHQAHLTQGSVSNALACDACHAVPAAAQALSHFTGNGAPGAISFSTLATKGVTGAAYTGGTCSVYCHGSGTEFANPAGMSSPQWTATNVTCTTCHGNPPASGPAVSGQTAHAFHVTGMSVACATCHPVPPGQLGSHVNGAKDVVVHPSGGGSVNVTGWDCTTCHNALGISSGHATPFPASAHGPAAIADIGSCTSCHGADYSGGTGPSCNACHATQVAASAPDWKANCTFCHGTRTASVTTATAQAAPPQSVVVTADQTRTNAKIGAHQAHLVRGTYANALPCSSCHTPPGGAAALTHFGGGAATIAFSALASQGVASPAYAGSGAGCTVYCHGSGTSWPAGSVATNGTPAWTSTGLACNACHGNPPSTGPAVSGQPAHVFHVTGASVACATCHAVPPGDLGSHVNGTKDVVVHPSGGGAVTIGGWDCTACHSALGVSSGHAVPFPASAHGPAAIADIGSCTTCHGATYSGGTGPSCNACHATQVAASAPDWKANCTFCHGTRTANVTTATALAAPPQAVAGATSTSDSRVGAHQKHLGNGSALSNGVACTECHPAATGLAHLGGGTAQLSWGSLATTGGAAASMSSGTCANYCHGATLPGTGRARPAWAPPTSMTCGSCHQANPTTGQHPSQNSSHSGIACGTCHGTGFTSTAVNKALHIDGSINKASGLNWQGPPQYTTKSCGPSCHGRENW